MNSVTARPGQVTAANFRLAAFAAIAEALAA
jgi:hypothetical protein